MTDKTSLKFHVVIHWLILSKTLYQRGSKSQLFCNYDQSLHSSHTSVTCTHPQLDSTRCSFNKNKRLYCVWQFM